MLDHVLLVDDDEPLRTTYRGILRLAGFKVDCAGDGRAAAEMAARRSYDVVVSDIDMPYLDGLQMVRLLRERGDSVPVVLLTGGPSPSASATNRLGVTCCLLKPVRGKALREAIVA